MQFAGPLALLLAILVGIGPLVAWRRERRPVFKKLPIPALLGVTALAITDHPLARHEQPGPGSALR